MNDLIKILKSSWVLASMILLSLSVNCIYAQQSNTRDAFIERINTAFNRQDSQKSDSIFNVLKEEAWSLKEDSLYVDLTFQQIEKNKDSVDIFLVTTILENLMIKEYEFLKTHPKLLLVCYLNLSKFYLSRYNTSKASVGLSKYYFERYLEILKTIPLSTSDIRLHQKHRLRYLQKTQNDSLLYYLNSYELPKQTKNLILTRWYRSKDNHKKELIHAKQSGHSLELLVAYRNNLQLSKVDSLFPILLEKFKGKNSFNEHLLYLNMGHRYALERRFDNADKMYLKALNYFEDNKKAYQINECLEAILDVKTQIGDLNAFKFYNTKLNALKQQQHEEQLLVIEKYLSFVKDITLLEAKTKKKAEKLEKEQAKNELKYQKTITSVGLAFFLVFSIFIFFYFQSVKERETLEYKNEKMKVDVLRSKFKPHFTFNALSVINYFIAKKDVENASNALTKMATLLRSTLDNMSKDLVSYESEYNICKDYMYLEMLRFSDRFECDFKGLNDPIIKGWKVPPGIIEPFLENSVNHAFKGVKSKGMISLTHQIENNCLVICVKDNGVGIDTEKIYSENLHGMKITKDVIKATSKLYKTPIKFEIKSNGGTVVTLTVPLLKS
ncbi:histidine kinase [Flavobacteriaceae bacterium]|nr:histidine kinase [Flavobacteriaceae bacterium]